MSVLLLLFLPLAAAQPWQVCQDSRGKYTSNSTYQANIQSLSSTLPAKAAAPSTGLFATRVAGNAPDTVYALAFCRGDITNASACAGCVASGFQDAQQLCPFNKAASLYYDLCLLRFADENFLATNNSDVVMLMNSQNFTASVGSVRLLLFTLLNATAESAASSSRRFTTSRLDVSSLPTLYCLMQCTPDLTAGECAACFEDFPRLTLQYLDGARGGRILATRCTMRYEIYPFYSGDTMLRIINLATTVPEMNTTAPTTPVTVYPQPAGPGGASAPPPPQPNPGIPEQAQRSPYHKSKVWIVAIVAPLLAILFCFMLSIVWIRRGRKGEVNMQNNIAAVNRLEEDALVWRLEERSSEFSLFEFSELLEATDNFAAENRLGQGGFGPVYKGQLHDGVEVAVKRLASQSGQGFTEFKNEVELIAKLQHTNLVRLLGCCIQGEEKILVYEYLPNKSLDFFIFGIAQGLLYLHKHSRLRVIHRDLKASNILLDQDMNPKISDFGLAKIFSSNNTEGNTKRVVGTYGYMSPEYASEGIYSIKSDVFSFGVLLLEILSGKRNSGFHQYGDFLNLLGYAWHMWEEGRWLDIIGASIPQTIPTEGLRKYINIALMCVQENADDRPTMSDVVAMLSSESAVLPEPKHPAYYNLRVSKVQGSTNVVQSISVNDVTITSNPEGR
ncbi:hypothetical protein OsJ_01773 [Oryza sativa Japonica Group]|uniref:non-specific serine/threonine protein kinase n=1 Tax=Oryza sativa subsp. japonica TaxID=39947 RepID=B9EWR6_ORYSJ|nr:hypothetical protein OsJ_01773 [Oryza sativa Japonica Group]